MSKEVETQKQGKARLWTGDFVLLMGIAFTGFICCQGMNNGTPLYVAALDGPTSLSGVLIMDFCFSAAVARVVAGPFIDNGHRVAVMRIGAACLLLGTVLSVPFPGLKPMVLFRALQGIGFAFVTTAASTAAADVVSQRRLGEGIGYFSMGQSLGMAVGPAYGVFLCSLAYGESLFVGIAAVAAVLLLLTCVCRYEHHPERLPEDSAFRMRVEGRLPDKHSVRESEASEEPGVPRKRQGVFGRLFEKTALPGALPMVIICLAFAIPTSYTALYAAQYDFGNPGMFFVFGAVTMTAARLFGGKLLDTISPKALYLFVTVCLVAMFCLMAFAVNEMMLYSAGIFFGLAMGFGFPLLNSIAVKCTIPARWGAANALFFIANDMGVGIGAIIWGCVIDMWGFGPVFAGGAVTAVVSYVVGLACFAAARRIQARRAGE